MCYYMTQADIPCGGDGYGPHPMGGATGTERTRESDRMESRSRSAGRSVRSGSGSQGATPLPAPRDVRGSRRCRFPCTRRTPMLVNPHGGRHPALPVTVCFRSPFDTACFTPSERYDGRTRATPPVLSLEIRVDPGLEAIEGLALCEHRCFGHVGDRPEGAGPLPARELSREAGDRS
jgi:hypothetical protein